MTASKITVAEGLKRNQAGRCGACAGPLPAKRIFWTCVQVCRPCKDALFRGLIGGPYAQR